MDYQLIWFGLWGILWAAYFMTDGFDLGVGILYPLLGTSEAEKRVILNTIGPVWDGNKVWLVAAGGATFAAFPAAYAAMFSYFYTPLFLILIGLIFRGVAFEFRGKGSSALWKAGWDTAIFLGSLLPTILFGIAFGNIFQGLPIDARGYHGSLLTLLNPYGLITGCLFFILFTTHGALWLAMKTDGDLARQSQALALKLWITLFIVTVLFLIHTALATPLPANYLRNVWWFIIPLVAVAAMIGIGIALRVKSFTGAFLLSCLAVVAIVLTGVIGLYPNLIPSYVAPHYSLTLYNASSSVYTLRIMTAVAAVFVPVVIAYQIWVYRVFKGKLTAEDVVKNSSGY